MGTAKQAVEVHNSSSSLIEHLQSVGQRAAAVTETAAAAAGSVGTAAAVAGTAATAVAAAGVTAVTATAVAGVTAATATVATAPAALKDVTAMCGNGMDELMEMLPGAGGLGMQQLLHLRQKLLHRSGHQQP